MPENNILTNMQGRMNLKSTSLVTGAAGFIGSHVVDELLKLGHAVVALDDLSGGFADNVNPKAQFVRGSILDPALIPRLFAETRFDYVFHLAAYAAEGLSHFIRRFNYQNSLLGSVNLINAAVNHEVKCFVFTSSIAVCGRNQLPMTEETVPLPENPYGIAKFAVEQDLRAAHELFGLNSIVFRPQFSLEDGLTRMVAWVKKSGARQSKKFGALDMSKNLPPSWRE